MGRILGVDYGGKRTGLAWTDPLQISINPLETVLTEVLEDHLTEMLVNTSDVSTVVFGLPTHADGKVTEVGKKMLELKARLSHIFKDITWEVIDEAYTSREARRLMVHLGVKKKKREKKQNLDKMSAVLILKSYLDSQ